MVKIMYLWKVTSMIKFIISILLRKSTDVNPIY